MQTQELYTQAVKRKVAEKYEDLKKLGVMNIKVKKEHSKFYKEEIIKLEGNPTQKTWDYYKDHKLELRDRGIYIYKECGPWYISAVIVPSQIYINTVSEQVLSEAKITDRVSDEIKQKLRPHQLKVIDYNFTVFREKNLFIDTSDAGTGKTYVALALIKQMNLIPILIIPAVSIYGWTRALEYYGITRYYISTYELFKRSKFTIFKTTKKGTIIRENIDFPFLNVENKYFEFSPLHCVIYDEAHRLKNIRTENFRSFVKMMEKPPPYLMFLSATISESHKKAIPIFYAIGKISYPQDFNKFMMENGFFFVNNSWWYRETDDSLLNIHKYLTSYGTRMKLESIDGLPANIIIPETYAIDEAPLIENLYKAINDAKSLQRKEDHSILKEHLEKLKKVKLSYSIIETIQKKIQELQELLLDAEIENQFLAIRTRLLQIIELNKIPLLIDLVENALDDGYSVCVFLNYVDSITILSDELKTRCIYTGKNKELGFPDREQCRLEFQEGKSDLIIGTFSAMRESVDLHDTIGGHPRMVFMPFSDSAQSFVQALGRVHRAGKLTPSVQYIICVGGTVEEKVKENLEKKLFNLSMINDGDLDPTGVYSQIYKGEERNERNTCNVLQSL